MPMTLTGRKVLIEREGLRLKAYHDSKGILTIGVGHTTAAGSPTVKPGMEITADEAGEILAKDLHQFEQAVDRALKRDLADHELDALYSVCFNVGPHFATSTCIRRINAGDISGAADAILLWNKPPEIISRRKAERLQFLIPYDKSPPVARVEPHHLRLKGA